MPAKSKAQFKFMKMMEHNPEKAKKQGGPSPKQAKEFTESNKGKKSFSKLPEKKAKKEGKEGSINITINKGSKENVDHFAPHLDHPQLKNQYPGTKITGKCVGGKFCSK